MPSAPFSEPVSEYASPNLIAVRPTATLDAVARLLEDRGISGVAVTDVDGTLRGIVSTRDILRAVELELHPRSPRPVVRPTERTAAEAMVRTPVTIDSTEPIRTAARLMMERRIHRVIVVRNGRAVGVVSTRDVMRAVLRHRVATPLRAVMSTPVETVDIGQPVEVAVAHLADANVRGLVVVDGHWPVGVFTQTEAIQVRALPRDLLATPVEEMMSYEVLCLDVQTPLVRVAGHAVAMNVRRVLAVEAHRLCGIATGFDLARVAANA